MSKNLRIEVSVRILCEGDYDSKLTLHCNRIISENFIDMVDENQLKDAVIQELNSGHALIKRTLEENFPTGPLTGLTQSFREFEKELSDKFSETFPGYRVNILVSREGLSFGSYHATDSTIKIYDLTYATYEGDDGELQNLSTTVYPNVFCFLTSGDVVAGVQDFEYDSRALEYIINKTPPVTLTQVEDFLKQFNVPYKIQFVRF